MLNTHSNQMQSCHQCLFHVMVPEVGSQALDDSVYLSPYFTVLNVSTSAQLTYAMPADFKPPDCPQPASAISYFPYFDDMYLAVAASLNGGNVLATFVEMLTGWMNELGMYVWPLVIEFMAYRTFTSRQKYHSISERLLWHFGEDIYCLPRMNLNVCDDPLTVRLAHLEGRGFSLF